MRIHALAVDYDGTIAHHGVVSPEVRAGLEAVRRSGRRLILVTGRVLDDLRAIDASLPGLFDMVVAENGAVLFDPARQQVVTLAEAPPDGLIEALRRAHVPFGLGQVVVASEVPHEVELIEAIQALGIEWQVIFNKGAVMALPSGVNKGSGLQAALQRLDLSPHNVAGVGDAENDHAFLSLCEVAVAPANALPAIRERAALVMRRHNGRGVVEFIEHYLLDDLQQARHVFARYNVEAGVLRSGQPLRLPVHGSNVLVVGTSGGGKSTLTGVLIERLVEQGYQVCVIDPEGDYTDLEPLVVVGSPAAPPALEEITIALQRAPAGVVVNLVAQDRAHRVRFSGELLSAALSLRSASGRPHWIVLDEAHHLLPAKGSPGTYVLPEGVDGICLVTLRPDLLAPAALAQIDQLCVVGEHAGAQLAAFASARTLASQATTSRGRNPTGELDLLEGEALAVRVQGKRLLRPQRFRVAVRQTLHRRHVRKYAAGDLGDSSFYFRGPDGRLNLRAYNVTAFAEMARGVDLDTWRFHLKRGDLSAWFRDKVKDPELAAAIAEHETATSDPDGGRDEILRLIEARYTADR